MGAPPQRAARHRRVRRGGAAGVVAAAYPLLLAARCLQAVCGAVALVNAAALVRTAVPEQQRGRAFGAVGAAATGAAAAAPLAAGSALLTQARALTTAIAVPAAFGVLVLALLFARHELETPVTTP